MNRLKVPEEQRHMVPVASANAVVDQIEQSLQILELPKSGNNGNVDPELDMIMMGMPTAFNPKAAGKIDATIQYTLTGAGGGRYYVHIKDGKCTAHRGSAVDADLSIYSPAEVWKAISKGEIPGLQSYMDGKYQWSGDLKIIMILDNLFEKTGAQKSPIAGTHTRKGEEEIMTDKSTLNCHDIIAGMPKVFDAAAAGDLIADIQFDISGKEPGSYHLHIEKGTCSFLEGEVSSPSLTIHTPSEVWLAVSRGEIDGQAALMQGKYTVEGDFNLLLKLNEIFL